MIEMPGFPQKAYGEFWEHRDRREVLRRHSTRHSTIGCLLLLAACTGGAQQTGIAISQDAAATSAVVLSADDVARLRQTCAAASPVLAQATSPVAPAPVSGTAVYPAAFCGELLTGAVPPTADRSSLTWLPKVLSAVETTARVAGYVLPAVLPLL